MQGDVERPLPASAPIHRSQHLDIAHRILAEGRRDALGHHPQQSLVNRLRGVDPDQMKVAVRSVRCRRLGQVTGVDAVGVDDDPRGGGLRRGVRPASRKASHLHFRPVSPARRENHGSVERKQ